MSIAETGQRFMLSFNAATSAFRREWSSSSLLTESLDYSSYLARRQRYEICWAYYKNNAYSDEHAWATPYRQSYALYQHIRNIYTPSHRVAMFWQGALAGGALDPDAGDGTDVKSALPILTENEALRPALSQLWRDSHMNSKKDEYTLLGTIFGDAGWRIHDDVEHGKVILEPLHASMLYDVVRDIQGNVKAYTLIEPRWDPTSTYKRAVLYSETAERDGDEVIYRTYKDKELYAWDNVTAEWSVPYGFVPLVVVKHSGIGEFGDGEYADDLAKIREIDDLASMVHDAVRKAVNAPMILAGVDKAETQPTTRDGGLSMTQRIQNAMTQAGRQEIPVFYGPAGATAVPIIADFNIKDYGERVDELLKEFGRDHPELRIDELRVSGGLTGRALELAREPAEIKGMRLRTNYDAGIIAAQQMAISIGGYRGYDGYQGFDLNSFGRGDLEHTIGARPIFSNSEIDTLEYKEKFWKVVVDTSQTVDKEIVLKDLGWSQTKIDETFAEEAATADTTPLINEVQTALAEFRSAMSTEPTAPVIEPVVEAVV